MTTRGAMIHWGGEVLQGQQPRLEVVEEETLSPPQITATTATILHAPNPSDSQPKMNKSSSLSECLMSLPLSPESSSNATGTSLLAAPWQLRYDRIHHPIDRAKVRDSFIDGLNSIVPLFRERKTRKPDLLVPSKKDPPALLVIHGPGSVRKSQLFSMHLTITNTSKRSYTAALYFRLDCGKQKIESARKDVSLEPGESAELVIKIANDSIWTDKLLGTETHFIAVGTAHIKDTGELLNKLSRLDIKWQRPTALSQLLPRRLSKTLSLGSSTTP